MINPTQIVVLDDGRVAIPTDNLSDDDLNIFTSIPFKTDYPIFLRFGLSKNFPNEDVLFAADIVTSLNNMFGNEERWKIALGTEINKNPKMPFRFGLTIGGRDRLRFSLGSGYTFGKMKVDIAYGHIGGLKMSKARGLDLGLNIFYDYKESDKEKLTFIDKIKNYFINLFSKDKKLEEKNKILSPYFKK